jgi:hypothetical protein
VCVAKPTFEVVSAKVIATSRDVIVKINYVYEDIDSYVGIWWENNGSVRLKAFHRMNSPCAIGRVTDTLTWESDFASHLPRNGARFYVLRFRDPNNPIGTLISKVEIR